MAILAKFGALCIETCTYRLNGSVGLLAEL